MMISTRRLTAQHVADHGLLALQALIDPEEVLDLAGHVGRQLGNIRIQMIGGVLEGDGDDLLIQVAAVLHGDDADGEAAHQTHGADGLAAQHQHVQKGRRHRPRCGE